MTKPCTCWCHVTTHLIISNDKGPQHRKTEIATHPWQRTNKQSHEVDTYCLQGLCYITVGMFTQCGLGSAKQQHWVVCSEFCLSTKSKEDLDSFWWQVVNLQRNKSSCMKNNCEIEGSGMGERGSEVYWLLAEYSSTTKEVKSGATSYPVCLTYIPR